MRALITLVLAVVVQRGAHGFVIDAAGRLEGETCAEKCVVAGHCCIGNSSACQKPSCQMGCTLGNLVPSFAKCNQSCYDAISQCTYKAPDGTLFQQCGVCPERWLPPGTGSPGWWPPGYQLPTCNSCGSTKDECTLGCQFAFNPALEPQKPTLAPTPAGRPEPPVPPSQTLNFSWTHGDHMVLQQAPQTSAVYGFIGTTTGAASVSVTITPEGSVDGFSDRTTLHADVNGTSWKVLLPPTVGSITKTYTVTATCTAGCTGTVSLHDVVFGEVWYCGGQSNMALPVKYTYHRNTSVDSIAAGKFGNIRLHGLKGNMNQDQPWIRLSDAVKQPPGGGDSPLFMFSSTCYYFGESLTEGLGKDAPPIGLIHTAWGGSMIEEWVTDDVAAECTLADHAEHNELLWDTNVKPYLDMTVKGWVWYQGENNCGTLHGNSATHTGYGCLMPALVALWRKAWSVIPQTTSPKAPFGIVSLSPGDSEGAADIASFRWSQGANYGVVPNPAMPATFLAHAYDLEDVWIGPGGAGVKCNATTVNANYPCDTPWYMGPGIHPRLKKPVGQRLAYGAMATAYTASGPVTGPTISGCTYQSTSLTITFNTTLLAGAKLEVQPYDKTNPDISALSLFVNDSVWVSANIALAGPNSISVDVASVGPMTKSGVTAIRYAWGDPENAVGGDVTCCRGVTGSFCPMARCPIVASVDSPLVPAGILPTNPFLARIENGKCVCPNPQICAE